VNSVVLVLGSRSSSGRFDWRGSDERCQANEGDREELHGSVLAATIVVVVCGVGRGGVDS
jgi:hypothetical protein